MLYARLAESNSNQASLNSFPDNVRSFYMGESFSLSFVVRSLSSNAANRSGPKLHYPIPNTVSEHANNAAERLKDTDTPTLTYLNMHGAFILPSQDISDELIRIFFTSFHPAYPVFDRREFFALYQQNQVPLIVLQTIYFLSFTICGEDLLRRAGFVDRYSARRTSYLRAKALYDMDCEKNKVKLTSVLFLLGFWWEGPEDQKDTWHWLGAAISLAQTLGMHRSYVALASHKLLDHGLILSQDRKLGHVPPASIIVEKTMVVNLCQFYWVKHFHSAFLTIHRFVIVMQQLLLVDLVGFVTKTAMLK